MAAAIHELCPYRKGDRVRLRPGIDGPSARTGTVVETFGLRGVRVHHDKPHSFSFFDHQDFNWMLHEVERES